MDDTIINQISTDIELAKTMTDIDSPEEVLALVNRLIGYMDLIGTYVVDTNYKADIWKGKFKTLQEFVRTGKERHKSLKDIVSRY